MAVLSFFFLLVTLSLVTASPVNKISATSTGEHEVSLEKERSGSREHVFNIENESGQAGQGSEVIELKPESGKQFLVNMVDVKVTPPQADKSESDKNGNITVEKESTADLSEDDLKILQVSNHQMVAVVNDVIETMVHDAIKNSDLMEAVNEVWGSDSEDSTEDVQTNRPESFSDSASPSTTFLGTMDHQFDTTTPSLQLTSTTTAAPQTTVLLTTTTQPTTTTSQEMTTTSQGTTTTSQGTTTTSEGTTTESQGMTTMSQSTTTTSQGTTTSNAISTTATTRSTTTTATSVVSTEAQTLEPITVDPRENLVLFEKEFQRRLWKQANFDSNDIIDVVTNFIAENNPVLQLLVSVCFLHPKCYPLEEIHMKKLMDDSIVHDSAKSKQLMKLLKENFRESARDMVIREISQVQENIKTMMFEFFSEEVAKNGTTVDAVKSIIDSVKVIWEKTNSDLESAKMSIRELFYLLEMKSETEVTAIVEIFETAAEIPAFVEGQYRAALLDENKNRRQSRNFGVWDSVLNFS